jgi:NTP pyrophosphatase (non-canonical NTP hydrolase)
MPKTFQQVIDENVEIIEKYKAIEGKPWNAEGSAMELTKQVGELCKLIMVTEGYYFKGRDEVHTRYDASAEKIADELSDILREVIRLSHHYKIDLEKASDIAAETDRKFIEELK